jgi:hypothetical protein
MAKISAMTSAIVWNFTQLDILNAAKVGGV